MRGRDARGPRRDADLERNEHPGLEKGDGDVANQRGDDRHV